MIEQHVADHELFERARLRFRNALPTAKRRLKSVHPDLELKRTWGGKNKLAVYCDLMDIHVPEKYGKNVAAKGIKAMREAIGTYGSYSEITAEGKLECMAMLDALDIAGGLYRLTSYHSFLQVRTEYQGLTDWPIADAFAGSRIRAPEFIRHQAETSVDRVSEDAVGIVQATMSGFGRRRSTGDLTCTRLSWCRGTRLRSARERHPYRVIVILAPRSSPRYAPRWHERYS